MNNIVSVISGAVNMERRFEDKTDAKVFARQMKLAYPAAEIVIGQREAKWHTPKERAEFRRNQKKQAVVTEVAVDTAAD